MEIVRKPACQRAPSTALLFNRLCIPERKPCALGGAFSLETVSLKNALALGRCRRARVLVPAALRPQVPLHPSQDHADGDRKQERDAQENVEPDPQTFKLALKSADSTRINPDAGSEVQKDFVGIVQRGARSLPSCNGKER